MKLSRFVGASVREAMRQVREALGPDALIVSNRSIDGGVEVVATADSEYSDEPPASRQPAAQPDVTSQAGDHQPASRPAAPPRFGPPSVPQQPAPPPEVMRTSALGAARAYAAQIPLADPDAVPPRPAEAAPAAGAPAGPATRPSEPIVARLPDLPVAPSAAAPASRASFATSDAAPLGPATSPHVDAAPAASPASAAAMGASAAPASRSAPDRAPIAPSAPAMPSAPAAVSMPATPAAMGMPATPPTPAAASMPATSATPAATDMPAAPMANAAPPADVPSPAARPTTAGAPPPSMARTPDAPLPSAFPAPSLPADTGSQVQAALNALRSAMESRMDGLLWGGAQAQGLQPVNAALFRSLLEAGFSMPLVRALVERLPAGLDRQAAMAWARNELVTHLPVMRSENDFLAGGGVIALVGPTGVGKTTTLAKLAARCVAREGRDQVAMLTTDLFRIGALEQLQIYGRLMGVPAHSIRDGEELKQALAHLGHRKIILIDTTGISQRDRKVAALAALLHAADRPVRRLLVLNAASQGDTLDEVAHAYRNGASEDVVGCIITKLDEATRIAPALDTAIRHRLPIHYVSIGQKVPEDMEAAERQALVDRALAPLPREADPLYAPSEADLAALWRSSTREDAQQKQEAEASAAARRRQLLAAAVLPQAGAQVPLEQGIAWLEADAACAQARENWRLASTGSVSAQALGEAGLKRAREAYAAGSERHLLAMHGKAALKGQGGSADGALLASLLMTDRGAALAAPLAHLALPHGILNACDIAAPMPANAVDALLARVQALHASLDGVPLVHLFELTSATLWQAMAAADAAWVARGAGTLRVMQEDSPTTLAAVSRDLGYLPVGTAPAADGSGAALDLWASGTEVRLAARGHEDLALRMVCARLTDPADGKVVNQLYGLTNMKAAQAGAPVVARWLVQQEQARMAFRHMAHAWTALPPASGLQAMPGQAMLASQLGAACWQLAQAPQAAAARAMLQAMAAGGRKLTGPALPGALAKGFAMLEMAA